MKVFKTIELSDIEPFDGEVFEDVFLFNGDYMVSTHGRVASFKDEDKPILLRQKTDKDGYLEVGLWRCGKQHFRKVHQLVAETFIDNNDLKPQVNHIDFNRGNNHISNLEWATKMDDAAHKSKHGRFPKGEKSPMYGRVGGRNLNSKMVLDTQYGIFYDCAKDAATLLGINYSTLKGMLNGNDKNYSHLVYI